MTHAHLFLKKTHTHLVTKLKSLPNISRFKERNVWVKSWNPWPKQ